MVVVVVVRRCAQVIVSCLALAALLACSTIPTAGAPGEVVRDEVGPTKRPIYRVSSMVVLLQRRGQPYPPYAADLRVVPKGEDRARLGLIMVTPQQSFSSCGELFLHAGEAQLPIRGIEYASTLSHDGYLEGWWIDVDVSSVAKMAAATDAGGAFCGVDWRFDKEQNATLRKWVAAVTK